MDEGTLDGTTRDGGGESNPSATTRQDLAESVDGARAQRFYDRLRQNMTHYLARGVASERLREFLFLVPDVFILLWRLASDSRVATKDRMLLGSGLAYYIFPLDIVPEAFLGPVGFLDDLVFGVYILNKLLSGIDESVLRQHWSGSGDVFDAIRRVIDSADGLVASDFLKQIKRFVK